MDNIKSFFAKDGTKMLAGIVLGAALFGINKYVTDPELKNYLYTTVVSLGVYLGITSGGTSSLRSNASNNATTQLAGRGLIDPASTAPKTPTPTGFVRLGLLLAIAVLALLFAIPARAQTPAPADSPATPPEVVEAPPAPSSPLTVQLTPDLSLRLNVSLVAATYDVTHKAFLGQVPVTGLYVLSSKRLLEAGIGVGGRVTIGNGSNSADAAFSGSILGALVSPKLSIGTVNFHGALTAGYQFGVVRSFTVGFVPTVEF